MWARSAAACVLLSLAGCVSVRHRIAPPEYHLSDDEQAFAQALAYYAQGLIHEAEQGIEDERTGESFRRAAELDPAQHKLSAKAALSLLRQGRTDEAIALLKDSRDRNPDDVQAYLDLAVTCQITGRVDDAIRYYEQALKLDDQDEAIYVTLAGLYFHKKQDETALAVLERAVKKTGKAQRLAAHAAAQGRRYVDMKEAERAVPCFEFAARHSETQKTELHRIAGELDLLLKNRKGAIYHLDQSTRLGKSSPEVFVRLGLLQAQDDTDTAIGTLKRGVKQYPDTPPLLFSLAYLLGSANRTTEAIEVFKDLHELAGKKPDIQLAPSFYLQYGAALDRVERSSEAETILEECIELHPRAHEVLNYLAYVWAEKGKNLDRARDYVTRALEIEPDNGAYVDTLGWILFREGKHEDALPLLLRANELLGGDATVEDHIGDAYRALGNTDEAIARWKASLMLDHENDAVAEKLKAHGVDIRPLRKRARRLQRKREAEDSETVAPDEPQESQ